MAWAMKTENQFLLTSQFYCKSKNMTLGIFFPIAVFRAYFRGSFFLWQIFDLTEEVLFPRQLFRSYFRVGLFSGLGGVFSGGLFVFGHFAAIPPLTPPIRNLGVTPDPNVNKFKIC